jgi:hypothetical protein
MTVFIPRLPKESPRPEPLMPSWVGTAGLMAIWAAFGAAAAALIWLMVLILTA